MNSGKPYSSSPQELAALARESGLILLYHGVWSHPPLALASAVHNVSPDVMHRQLEAVQQHFEMVSVDEFAQARETRGLAAVSFDDGYRCITQEALPVFESLKIPFSVYLNGSSFRGSVFWRDKIRFIEESGLLPRFERSMRGIDASVAKRFYRYTKHPRNNSVHVTQEVDRFLSAQGLADRVHRELRFCFSNIDELVSHPLVSYGNHSESHYVMASLDAQQQREQIEATRQVLASRTDINLSEYFSIPFGDESDFNAQTVSAVRDLGYRGVLLSRGHVHRSPQRRFGLPAFDRFMPRQGALLGRVGNWPGPE